MERFRGGISIVIYAVVFLFFDANSCEALASTPNANRLSTDGAYGFIENRGQLGTEGTFVKYYYHAENFVLYLTDDGLIYKYLKFENSNRLNEGKEKGFRTKSKFLQAKTEKIKMRFVEANTTSKIYGELPRKDVINYYNKSTLGVRHFDKVVYENFYPGIDWVIYIFEKGLKYDFIVHPGADPDVIKMVFTHNGLIQLQPNGGYIVKGNLGSIAESRPIAFQEENEIPVRFTLTGDTIGFEIEDYDNAQALVIDPELIWATYFGGWDTDYPHGVSSDTFGNVYMTGETYSFDNIAYAGFQNTMGNTETYYGDAFLVKYNSSGDRLWSTYYGGNRHDEGQDVEVDSDGNVYMGGIVESWIGAIATPGAHQTIQGGWIDAFLVKFNTDGVRQWGTYIGGSGGDQIYSLASDVNNNIYVAGSTDSPNAIALNGHQSQAPTLGSCAFMQKFSPTGQLLWGTYYGMGTTGDGTIAHGCTVDNDGNPYMGGVTTHTAGIAHNGFKNSLSGDLTSDAFLVKFNAEGVRLWGTYFGGNGHDVGFDCSADPQGNVYLAGNTPSTAGIAFNGHQNEMGGIGGNGSYGDAFLVKFDSEGNRLWGTYYGGENDDVGYSCDADINGGVYLSGVTRSATQISSPDSFSETHGNPGTGLENRDMFLVRFNDSGDREWATYFGGPFVDHGGVCHAGFNNTVYLCGITNSGNLAQDGFQDAINGGSDGVLAKFNSGDCSVSSAVAISACDSFTWSANGETYAMSGEYSTTLASVNNCDSIIMLDLTINSSSHYEVAMSACESYTWPLSGQTYSSSGSYSYIMPNAVGCDSVITLQLSVHNPYFFESNLSVCDSLFWPATGETYFSSGQLSYYSTSVNGCDSTLILNLTVNESAHTSTDISACDSYSWPVNGENYTSDGVYTHVFTNSQGCDSSFTLNLSVNQSFLNTIEEKTCEPYYWPISDEVYSETGLYTFNFISSTSCDSTFILNLEVEPIEITIQPEDVYVEVGNTATFAIQTEFQDTEYQWQIKGSEGFIDLENIAPYMGVTTELLEIKVVTPAQANAQFRCIVSNQACEEISQVAELKVSTLNASIYPNPNDGKFTLAIPEELIGSMAKVYDDQGKLVLKSIIENQFTEFDMYYLASGIYQVVIPEIETLRFIILR